MISAEEKERQKEIYEYVSSTHILCLIILFSVFILSEDNLRKNIYPAINIRFLTLLSLIGFATAMLYNTRNISISKGRKILSWIDLVYVAFPLVISIATLLTAKVGFEYVETVLLLPILIAASIKGKPAGLIMATVCAFILVTYRVFYLSENTLSKIVESGLILIGLMYVVGWFIGGLAEVEAQSRKQLHYRAELERLVANISMNFINLPLYEIDKGINRALKTIGVFAGADRSYIFLLSGDGTKMDNIHKWHMEGLGESMEIKNEMIVGNLPWLMEKLNRFENIYIPHIADLSPGESDAEKEFLKEQNIQSLVIVPISYGKSLLGFLGLDSIRIKKIWLEDIITLLKMVGEIFVNAMERKKTEELLRLSEERFSKAFSANPNPMAIIEYSSKCFIDVNESFLSKSGYTREEVVGNTLTGLNLLFSADEYKKAGRMLLELCSIDNMEVKLRVKSGKVFVYLLSVEITRLGGKKCLLISATDISERKQFEREIARLEGLNLVGQMAASIGHEIRNPMTTVNGLLQLLNDKVEISAYKEYFNIMIEELDRANLIITEYLSLVKNKPIDLKMENLNTIIETIYPLLQASAVENNNYITMELGDIYNLPLDEKEIRQLILNLVRNGLEAMPSGKNLILKTYMEGKEVVISVRDQGHGINPDVMEKIGTPFFTTKDNGTGLGLAVCYSIAARHNAIIKVETGSTGTTFFVRFKLLQ